MKWSRQEKNTATAAASEGEAATVQATVTTLAGSRGLRVSPGPRPWEHRATCRAEP